MKPHRNRNVLKTAYDTHLRSLDMFTLPGCFYTEQLLSSPTYVHERRLNNQEIFPEQKY